MATKKAGGTAKNLTDVNPQYLGIKLYGGEAAKVGSVIVRQRGTRYLPGKNVGMGKDRTLFALKIGTVQYGHIRKVGFNDKTKVKKTVSVIEK
ncbi:50S ribosomal protein L27 [Patescibacteria group bacterium]|nr:50S ribosomal protein L27 [Patescibacteria group bacterium]